LIGLYFFESIYHFMRRAGNPRIPTPLLLKPIVIVAWQLRVHQG
jgi:hypothetical protein